MIGYPKSLSFPNISCSRFTRHAFGLIPTAKQKGRPDNPSGLSSERICTNACVAAFSEPTTNR
ncbi:hypothetical protein GRP92_03210 [Brucella melitensis]|uniref:hypothetical protein n=1 Tax=Brucella melitensis TaxID=29459 RepID=UPI001367BCD6|nr:hypothetical protein [Brucella melitensis]MXF79319.1 hypothetical protein [Brucella melitensis]